MKTIVAFSLAFVCFSSASRIQDRNPSFELLEERSEDGSPNLLILFPNGEQDMTILSKFYSNEEDRMAGLEHCNHIGHLAGEPGSTIAVTGCPGQDALEMTILSKNMFGSPMIKWNLDGSVERIENPFANPLVRSDSIPSNSTAGDEEWHLRGGDEMVNDEIDQAEEQIEIAEAITSAFCWGGWFGTSCGGGGGWWSPPSPPPPTNLPSSNTLQIRVGYEDSFRQRTGGNAAGYIESALAHVKAYYQHSSLGTRVNIQRVGSIKYYQGRNLAADDASLNQMQGVTQSELQGADLMVYCCSEQDLWGVIGLAYVSAVCTNNHRIKQSMNEWRQTPVQFAMLLAHEIGHNLGMSHDFDAKHGGKGGPCDNKGIMSYGNAPSQWSQCSKNDFRAHWYNVRSQWCM